MRRDSIYSSGEVAEKRCDTGRGCEGGISVIVNCSYTPGGAGSRVREEV